MSKTKTAKKELEEILKSTPFRFVEVEPKTFEIWLGLDYVCMLTKSDNDMWFATHNSTDRGRNPEFISVPDTIDWYKNLR